MTGAIGSACNLFSGSGDTPMAPTDYGAGDVISPSSLGTVETLLVA